MNCGKYMIYRLKTSEGDCFNVYFRPDTTLLRAVERNLSIQSYVNEGATVLGIVYVDEETYGNMQLNDYVEEYLENYHYGRDMRRRYQRGEFNRDVYVETMKLVADFHYSSMKRIYNKVRRLHRKDYDVWSELALQVHDEFLRTIM